MKFEWWMFVIGTVVSWGIYVPLLHQGQVSMGGNKPSDGAIRAFLCVGVAYLITAVVIPVILLALGWAGNERLDFKDADGNLNTHALGFATMGGIAGAAGALCVVFAMKYGGTPMYVPPLVFAGAPIVNAIVSVLWHWKPEYARPELRSGWLMFGAGILLAALGAGLVLYSKGTLDVDAKKLDQEARAKGAAAIAQAQAPETGARAGEPGAHRP
jgi:uncharacterized membrane protein